jgi:hypothetical protein
MRGAENVVSTREKINVYKILVGKTYRKKPLERLGVESRIILKWNINYIGLESVDWIHVAQNGAQWRAPVNTVMVLRVKCKVGNFLTN